MSLVFSDLKRSCLIVVEVDKKFLKEQSQVISQKV